MLCFTRASEQGIRRNRLFRKGASISSRYKTSLFAFPSIFLSGLDADHVTKLFKSHGTKISAEARGDIGPTLMALLAGAFMDH
ncbi:MAG TPA: hypothetical protein VKF42_06120 [Chitinivibrionales bacterium]|nr:hypothetical protein [Chitinivibrionales bacterium]